MKKKLITSSQIKKAFEDKTPLYAKKQVSVFFGFFVRKT
jgi:hypothetical protein